MMPHTFSVPCLIIIGIKCGKGAKKVKQKVEKGDDIEKRCKNVLSLKKMQQGAIKTQLGVFI